MSPLFDVSYNKKQDKNSYRFFVILEENLGHAVPGDLGFTMSSNGPFSALSN